MLILTSQLNLWMFSYFQLAKFKVILFFNLWTSYCWRGYRSIFRDTDVYGFYKSNQNIAALNFVLEQPTCMWFVDEDVWWTECQTAYKELGFGAALVLEYINILTWQLKLPFYMDFANFFTSRCLLEELENRCLEGMWTVNRMQNTAVWKQEVKLQTLRF